MAMAIKGRRSTPEERLRAVQLLREGEDADTIAKYFQTSRAIVYRWKHKYDRHGPRPPDIAVRLPIVTSTLSCEFDVIPRPDSLPGSPGFDKINAYPRSGGGLSWQGAG